MRIILKHSSVEDQRPTVEQAGQAGELLLNTHSAGAFLSCKDSAGDIHQVGGVKISTAAPANPVKGTVWLDVNLGLDRGLLKVYNGTQWVTGGGTFDACADGGLVQDSGTGCWSVELSIDDLTDVDTSTNAPAEGEILVWDGANWVPESLDDVQLDWSDLPACAGGGFIYDAVNKCWQVDWSTLPACAGGGFIYDAANSCWKVELDLEDLQNVLPDGIVAGDGLIWNGTNWVPSDDITDWENFPSCASIDWDSVTKCWGVDWSTFPGGDHLEWDNVAKDWNVIPVPPVEISPTAPNFKAEYFWWNSTTGELFLGYIDPDGDEYWVSASKPGEPGKDGDPVVISEPVAPPFQEDAIWFNTTTGEAFFGYVDSSGDEYWVSLSKPGPPGTDGIDGTPVIISEPSAPSFQEDAIWFNTTTGEAFFGYADEDGDEYWVALTKPGPPGQDGQTAVVQDIPPSLPIDGQIWHDSSRGKSYAYWSSQSVWVSI